MEPYDFSHLGADMQNWMEQRFMQPIAFQNFGWEYWIQIDFIAWLDASTGLQYDFQREIVRGNVRLDWLANANSAGPLTALEIKAQTLKRSSEAFVADVESDVAKLATVGGMDNRIMVAGVVSQDAADALVARNFVPITAPVGTARIYIKTV